MQLRKFFLYYEHKYLYKETAVSHTRYKSDGSVPQSNPIEHPVVGSWACNHRTNTSLWVKHTTLILVRFHQNQQKPCS